jgi:hypothetical protein
VDLRAWGFRSSPKEFPPPGHRVKRKKYTLQLLIAMLLLFVARQLRIEYKEAFYHVTSRGNQREQIFWDDRDREELKKILQKTKERYGYILHAYVFMDNHYHFLIETPYANIKQLMQNMTNTELPIP